MMDAATIRHMSSQAAMAAAFERRIPLQLEAYELEPPFPIPFIGNAVKEYGLPYEDVETFFVDSSGFGRPGEPALTINEFIDRANYLIFDSDEPVYWAITEAGQFQVYITAYHKTYMVSDDEIADMMPGEDAFYLCDGCNELHDYEDEPPQYTRDYGDICPDCWDWSGDKTDTDIVGDVEATYVEIEVFEKFGQFVVECWAYGTHSRPDHLTNGEGDLGIFDDADDAMEEARALANEYLTEKGVV
ncbi:MAG: hypothetical protein AMS18_00275 [Gemmatimonas sp. SG8_17]|nr:MAG: hypothetical protein AMS18_00275 [Gemmatimonas sp. SG8_17]